MISVSEEPSGLLSGWVRVTPREVRLRAASIFRFAGLAQAQEAGVEDSPALGLASVAVQIDETVQSALALANPGDQAAVVQLTLVDSQSGHEIATASVTVPSLGHLAGFVSELFESVAIPFTGTVRIQSDVPIAVVALRTSGGIPLSSYPVAHWAN